MSAELRGPWDYIIVGGGSAGCVLAARLSTDPACRVLLLSAGRDSRSPLLRVPGGVPFLIGNPDYDDPQISDSDASCHQRPIRWSTGRVLGGGSAINGMAWNRGLARDYDRWAQAGCSGWSSAELVVYFKRLEHFLDLAPGGGDPLRGSSGPQPVEFNQFRFAGLRPYFDACAARGIPVVADVNAFPQEGIGATQCSTRHAVRYSSRDAFLRPARRRPNLTVLVEARATTLRFDGFRCVGVNYRRDGTDHEAFVSGEVVLAAGTFGSPALLLRSGIGPADTLRPLDIPVVKDLQGVGRNLQDHVGVPFGFSVTLPAITAADTRGWRAASHGARWLLSRSGPAAGGAVVANGYIRSSTDETAPDLHLQLLPFGFEDSGRGSLALARQPTITSIVSVCHPRSRGELSLMGRNVDTPARCRMQLLGSPDDVRRLVLGLRILRSIHAAPALAAHCVREISPGPACASDVELEEYCRDAAGTQYHPVGTCAMGITEDAVVDSELRVRGIAGLRIADASVMPSLPSANTNAPVLMIAEKAGDLLEKARRER